MTNKNKEIKDNLKEALVTALFKAAGQILAEMGKAISEVANPKSMTAEDLGSLRYKERQVVDVDNDDY